jgi:thiol:disulfide interchange protein DsbA
VRLLKSLLLTTLLLSGAAFASPDNPQPGKEYINIATPQPTAVQSNKVELIEFFMYHCPACNAFEPFLNNWVKDRDATVSFKRMHIPHSATNDPEAHLFLTLDAMQLEGAMHEKVMRTWHVERRRLTSDADNMDWAANNGIDRQQFRSVYDSFSVTTKLRNLPRSIGNYGVDSTPTLVVDGRYLTNPAMVAAANPGLRNEDVGPATLRVIDALIELARRPKH